MNFLRIFIPMSRILTIKSADHFEFFPRQYSQFYLDAAAADINMKMLF